jgi:predicted ATP-binding protein involved in virulence
MRIDKIHIKNFKRFSEVEIPLNNQFNLIIGDNGSGKTAILEALTVAMGSYFLGLKNTDSRLIRESDVKLQSFEFNEEYQFPVVVAAEGYIEERYLEWSRELNSLSSGTSSRNAHEMRSFSEHYDSLLRSGTLFTMPVLAYYSTGRLFRNVDGRDRETSKRTVASRLRAYRNCLQAASNFKIFLKWYKSKEQAAIQKKEEDISLVLIRDLIKRNLPNCKNFFYEFDEDRIPGLKVEQDDGTILPFEYLSDGTRNIFALMADIAYRCLVLNPHLKENALHDTPGIILIDELDLHLHPEWQKQIVNSLKDSFKNIQFITTSHSPFIIQEMAEGQLIQLKDGEVLISGGDQLSIEDIAEIKQEVDNPQWSEKKKDLYEAAEEYYKALESGDSIEDMEAKMSELSKPFSQNPAYDAFLEQVRLTKEES